MAQSDSKVLVLSVLAGAAGVSLAALWYRRSRTCNTSPTLHLSSNAQHLGVDFGGAGAGLVLEARQGEVLKRLDTLIQCVSDLKEEVHALKRALPQLQDLVRYELEGRRPGSVPRTPRRKRAVGGERDDRRSSEEGESEGGYVTAHTDTEEEGGEEEEERHTRGGRDNLAALLEKVDALHRGTDSEKREGFTLLVKKKEEFGQSSEFLWRLARAYGDCHDMALSTEEKKSYAEAGKNVGNEAIGVNPMSAASHQWYAILCGLLSEYETVQNKIKNGYLFKNHLDKAIELNPQDPLSYYLLGRWCYAVAQLSWIERKVAATLFEEPPHATVEDALKNFLKVEEIHPKYSKFNYVFLAKCYKDLGQRGPATKMCDAASAMQTVSKEDEEAQKELESLIPCLTF
ncbi:regulator of microtubule dynamics protein 2 [Scleropages formosus]|uniref:Regulator of microtubule dynamics protein 2 n=1 Tax=Scleropages formosus TaxID=113540 RepID=A0A8C9R1X4_SCLFO|nr:regulator of microtubule dynamics protein 2 [Scleropages formosus]XP_029109999.1 regulator of microtubule dynamics protein 2 [Scleropages formosus]